MGALEKYSGQGLALEHPRYSVMNADGRTQDEPAIAARVINLTLRHRKGANRSGDGDPGEIPVFHKVWHDSDHRLVDRTQRVAHGRGAIEDRDLHLTEMSAGPERLSEPAHGGSGIRIARRSVPNQQQGLMQRQTRPSAVPLNVREASPVCPPR